MTRKDYIKIAEALNVGLKTFARQHKGQITPSEHDLFIAIHNEITAALTRDNSSFDFARFDMAVYAGTKETVRIKFAGDDLVQAAREQHNKLTAAMDEYRKAVA